MADPRLSKRDAFLAAVETTPVVMGILNVTPDSFSDGGRHNSVTAAVEAALRMEAEGAGIIDIGGESTRPGAVPVPEGEELARLGHVLGPVCAALSGRGLHRYLQGCGGPQGCGAGGLGRKRHLGTSGRSGHGACNGRDGLCSRRHAQPRRGGRRRSTSSRTCCDCFDRTLRLASSAGIPERYVILDPGFGFGKTVEQNYAVLAQLDRFSVFGRPILLGLSRKRMIGRCTGGRGRRPAVRHARRQRAGPGAGRAGATRA